MADFHFIRPLWLIAILVLIIAIYLLKKIRISQSGWHQLLPAHLSKILVDGNQQGQSLSLTLPFVIGLLSIVALAGPTWKKLPQPVYQVAQGSVIIMDMSYSMYATDLTPNRLTRARYKAIDLLNSIQEGDVGLIAYAGDAFVISPLTEDVNNIKLLLPSLTPDLMPELGSNPLSALTLAHEMLKNSGHVEGNIYWFTDGIDNEDIQDINEWSREHPYNLNVMGVGTTAGAPIKLTNGELMKDDSGAIIIPKLPQAALNGVAKRGDGNYVRLSNNDNDIERLTHQTIDIKTDKKSESENAGDQWQEFGPYLLLLVLPLVLSYFRRGALLAIVPAIFLLSPTKPVFAATSQNSGLTSGQSSVQSSGQSIWQNLWHTKDQQGQKSFDKQDFETAAQQFNNPLWQGSAHYQAGNYEEALSAFQQSDSAEALYNQGNALAKLQQFDQAIEAYDNAIAKAPNHNDAKANKALVEQIKQQQEQEQQNQDQDQNNEQGQDKNQEENQKGNQDKNQDSEQEDQQDSQQDSQQNPQEKNDQQQAQKNQQDQDQNAEQNEAQDAEQDKEKEQEQEQQEQQSPAQAQQAKASDEQLDKETQQKHQQLLNKVTDDPYLLLRNKMQLEYQKRRQNRTSLGDKKKW